MSAGERVEISTSELIEKLNVFCWIIDLEIYNAESITPQEDFISYSRCVEIKDYTLNNGRVNNAGYIHIVLTSVDLEIFLKTYRYKEMNVVQAYKYYKSYLPTDFINEMLSYYTGKTTLKGVEGKEEEYLNKKEMLNSTYGMVVTSPVRPNITYINNEWGKESIDLEKGIAKYNNNPNRFMPYVME